MRAIVYGDVHVYSQGEYAEELPTGYTSVLDEIVESMGWLASEVTRLQPHVVVCTGDTVHTQGYIDSRSLNVIFECYREVKAACDKVGASYWQILGNHDMFSDSSGIHSLPFMRQVATGATTITADREDILLLPYTKNYHEAEGWIRGFAGAVAVGHLDVKGALAGGYKLEAGIDPLAVMNKAAFLFFNGHIHDPQTIGNVVCVGSMMYHSFRDSMCFPDDRLQERGFVFLSSEDGWKWERIANPHTTIYHTEKCSSEGQVVNRVSQLRDLGFSGRTRLRIVKTANFDCNVAAKTDGHFRSVKVIDTSTSTVARRSDITLEMSPYDVVDRYVVGANALEDKRPGILKVGKELVAGALQSASGLSELDITFLSWHVENFNALGCADVGVVRGLTLVEADNGVGKSSLLEALVWALYGKTPRGVSPDDVVWHEPGKPKAMTRGGTFVSVIFLRGDREYQVVRTRKHKEFKNSLRVFCDGEDISAVKTKHTQEKLTSTLGLDYDDFVQVVFPSGMITCFTKLNDSAKKDVVESLINVQIYQAAHAEAKRLLGEQLKEIDTIEFNVDAVKSDAEVVEGTLQSLAEAYVKAFKDVAARVEAIREAAEQAKVDYKLVLCEVEGKKKEACALRDLDTELQSKFGGLSEASGLLESSYEGLKKSVVLSEEKLSRLDRLALDGSCWVCGKPMEKTDVACLGDLREKHAALGLLRDETGDKLKKVRDQAAGFRDQRFEAERGLTVINGELRELEARLFSLSAVYGREDRDIEEAEKHPKDLRAQINKQKERRQEIQAELAELATRLESSRSGIEELEFWAEGFSATGVRSFLLDKVLDVVNDRLVAHCAALGDVGVRLKGTRETKTAGTKSEISLEATGAGASYAKFSWGQRRRVDLAIQFALGDLLEAFRGSCNLLMLDEAEHGLDEHGLRSLVAFLSGDSKATFLTTQNPALKSAITGTLSRTVKLQLEAGVALIT